jgi:hypothetical protein
VKLLNYTTEVAASRSIAQIQDKLALHGAHQILTEYGGSPPEVVALSFKIRTKFGELAFRLPANIAAVQTILRKQFPRSNTWQEKAPRIAWRIIKDWIEAQLALLQTGQVQLEQVFLAFVQDNTGRTLYDRMVDKKFSGLALEDQKQ